MPYCLISGGFCFTDGHHLILVRHSWDIDELSLDSVFICLVNDGHTCNLTADGGKKTGAFSLYATESFLLDPLH